ncbi:MAG: LPS export ABC transporter ATP-binding protein [Legionellales bacterium]|nr:LPS export ABC transporter ATP-binding protein [Legionellales bacterium]|tara:strand:+ start:3181 stop:3906 length:726 start_codon:yes stop_codon:yes gene_type:complete
MSILSVRHLSKSYRSRKVVSDLSLSVQSGETIGLLGPNGAGKTTSFNMIVGLVPSDGGTIHLDNSEISRLSIDQRSHLGLGYLPQEASVFRKLTVEDNIMAILEMQMPNDRRKAKQRLELLLQEFHISHLRDNLGMSLSGGERRRLEIARALASEPRFLLLDEPFAGIDPISISDIQRLIHRLCEHGIGVLITDHNVRETLGTCDRAYIVNDGKILAEGSPELILNNEQVRDVYLGEQFSL